VRLDIYGPPRFFEAFRTPAVAAATGTLAAAVLDDIGSVRPQPG